MDTRLIGILIIAFRMIPNIMFAVKDKSSRAQLMVSLGCIVFLACCLVYQH